MKNLKRIVVIIALAYMPFTAAAWGVLGHRIVGDIAESYINAKTRLAIKQILGTESIAMTANWADFIKSDTSYNYLSNWHYVNLPENLSKSDVFSFLSNQPSANIYNKTNEMIAVLKNPKSTMIQKKLALRMIIHLVGDLHQPMHTARKDDLGGNKIQLLWFGEKSNLHRVWDEGLIDFQQLSYTEYTKAINHTTPQQVLNWQKADLKDCVYESYTICNKIYTTGIKNDDKLSYKYNFDWIGTVNEQLLKGGVRLAGILNSIYK
ncbi:S1/P1 Nuclease [Pedobacter polaris]|uniref:S1/P1 Nuclease n=1 Tax=Pedobacter polaris TaxID=2571273 RepID=A0A4U1CYX8_9SPHI|nr:S1/P1 nuclease [Pedobacter polaris]TKC12909.1 S1/P1 Nuclease [Pedobacter polaris]